MKVRLIIILVFLFSFSPLFSEIKNAREVIDLQSIFFKKIIDPNVKMKQKIAALQLAGKNKYNLKITEADIITLIHFFKTIGAKNGKLILPHFFNLIQKLNLPKKRLYEELMLLVKGKKENPEYVGFLLSNIYYTFAVCKQQNTEKFDKKAFFDYCFTLNQKNDNIYFYIFKYDDALFSELFEYNVDNRFQGEQISKSIPFINLYWKKFLNSSVVQLQKKFINLICNDYCMSSYITTEAFDMLMIILLKDSSNIRKHLLVFFKENFGIPSKDETINKWWGKRKKTFSSANFFFENSFPKNWDSLSSDERGDLELIVATSNQVFTFLFSAGSQECYEKLRDEVKNLRTIFLDKKEYLFIRKIAMEYLILWSECDFLKESRDGDVSDENKLYYSASKLPLVLEQAMNRLDCFQTKDSFFMLLFYLSEYSSNKNVFDFLLNNYKEKKMDSNLKFNIARGLLTSKCSFDYGRKSIANMLFPLILKYHRRLINSSLLPIFALFINQKMPFDADDWQKSIDNMSDSKEPVEGKSKQTNQISADVSP